MIAGQNNRCRYCCSVMKLRETAQLSAEISFLCWGGEWWSRIKFRTARTLLKFLGKCLKSFISRGKWAAECLAKQKHSHNKTRIDSAPGVLRNMWFCGLGFHVFSFFIFLLTLGTMVNLFIRKTLFTLRGLLAIEQPQMLFGRDLILEKAAVSGPVRATLDFQMDSSLAMWL